MVFCGHCGEDVPRSTFYRHRRFSAVRGRNVPPTRATNIEACENINISGLESVENYGICGQTSFNIPQDHEVNRGCNFEKEDVCYDESTPLSYNESSSLEDHNYASSSEDASDVDCDSRDDKEVTASLQDKAEQPEFWEDVSGEQLMSDLDCNQHPCPEPRSEDSNIKKVTNLLKWFVYFVLIWQSFCKVSDNGLEWLLQFQSQFLKAVSNICGSSFLKQLAIGFPSSLYLLRKLIGLDRDTFKKYAACACCSKLYEMDECTEFDRYGKRIVKYCTGKKFPKGKECGAPLSKKVILGQGQREEFYPLKIYCYNFVINKLEEMLCRNGFPEECEKWRELTKKDDFLSDVVDGKVWDDFNSEKMGNFLSKRWNFMFMLNFDYFQPLKHRSDYSVGVLYLANLNLPRNIRFKWENIIVAGIIPGFEDGKPDLNELLHPLVTEMKALWSGLYLKNSTSNIPMLCRAALACIACDIPAARKLCGFKSHNSNYGCSRCFKFFPGNVKESFDYSGFDRAQWPKRDIAKHRRCAKAMQKAKTKAEYQRLSVKYGLYYSPLIELEYCDVIRFTIIDPMHNLFLGTTKLMYKIWTENGLLSKKDLIVVEKRIKNFDVGTGLGRLPHKISSNHGCYTASQWKNWTLIYSLYALHGILPEQHMQCWQAFVLACKFLTKPVISKLDLDKADLMLMQFCAKFERLYGKSKVTPNMHLHGHLKECVLDFGPVYNFWCFSFERYNGIMTSFTTNNRSIEVQLMRKIVSDRFLCSFKLPSDFEDVFLSTVKKKTQELTDYVELGVKLTHASTTRNMHEVDWMSFETEIILPKVHKLKTLDSDDQASLASVYREMYNVDIRESEQLSNTVRLYGNVTIGNERFGSQKESRYVQSSRVVASWSNDSGQICSMSCYRPGLVKHYIQHTVMIGGCWKKQIFAVVDWLEESPQKSLYGRPVEVWKPDFVVGGPSTFIPLARIKSKFVLAAKSTDTQMIIVPLNRTFSF